MAQRRPLTARRADNGRKRSAEQLHHAQDPPRSQLSQAKRRRQQCRAVVARWPFHGRRACHGFCHGRPGPRRGFCRGSRACAAARVLPPPLVAVLAARPCCRRPGPWQGFACHRRPGPLRGNATRCRAPGRLPPRAAASVAMPYHGRPGLRRGRPGPARPRYGSQAPRQNFAGLQRRGAAKEPAPRCGKRKTAYPGRRLVSRSCQLTKTFLVSRQSLPRARPCVTTPSLAPSAGKACRRIGRPRARLAAADMSGHCHVPDQQRQRVATGPAARNKAFTPWPPACSAVSAACVEASPRRGEPCVAKRCRWAGRPRQGRVTETAAIKCVFLGPGRP